MLAVKHPSREPPTLPATLSTPDGSYVLKFDNPQNGGRWKPNYFTKLLIPADLRNKMFVSRQPPVGYGAVLVGIYRLRIPARCCLLGSECSRLSQPSSTSQDRHSPVSQSQRPSRFMIPPNKAQRVLRAKSVRWPPICAPPSVITSLRPSWAFWECFVLKSIWKKRASSWSNPTIPKKIPIVFVHGQMAVPYMWLPVMAARCSAGMGTIVACSRSSLSRCPSPRVARLRFSM